MTPDSELGLAIRVSSLERRMDAHEQKVQAAEIMMARITTEVAAAREDIATLQSNISRMIWTMVGFAFTVAGSAVAFAITVGGG